ncbi:MAG: hypothetical protein L6V93_20460 [Clostridiales bacterium]|nr:MAG: hypothetical protein L6V93_20460 [Clostridiales bacterium]
MMLYNGSSSLGIRGCPGGAHCEKNAKIPIIAEENYLKSSWCGETLDGIGRQKNTKL